MIQYSSLKWLRVLQAGKDMVGNDLLNSPDICIGAVVNPNFEPLDLQLIK